MQLVYLTGIFEDHQNIVRDLLETDSVNMIKNRPLVAKKHKKISVYVNLIQSYQKTMEALTKNNNTRKTYWLVTNCSET